MVFLSESRTFKFDDGLLERLRNALKALDRRGKTYGKINVTVNEAVLEKVEWLEEEVRVKKLYSGEGGPVNVTYEADEDES